MPSAPQVEIMRQFDELAVGDTSPPNAMTKVARKALM
jgi:hypothetical protein